MKMGGRERASERARKNRMKIYTNGGRNERVCKLMDGGRKDGCTKEDLFLDFILICVM